ncbi:c-type cytochrome [Gilvimarinus sp. F26214L]|uniref:c-type cytochrome n=1 Tax=Gilvimarinus sp. DZF01 TaxID=3461371 RepID=UPI0040464338
MHHRTFSLLTAVVVACLSTGTTADPRDADSIFDNYCFSCHGTGWDNAPVLGDSFAWDERKEKGLDVLLKNTVEGFNTMPPKGSCADCTEEELKAVVEMMIAES